MLSKEDRIAFSLQIVSATEQIQGFDRNQAELGKEITKLQKLDTANKNLFDPSNALVNGYQNELNKLDGNLRTVITEQDIQNSANKTPQNHFFPNDLNVVVPSLSATHNIWTKVKPFAITFAIGKSYVETYGTTDKESDFTGPVLSYISAAGSYTNIQLTTGQECVPTDIIQPFAAVQTLKTDLVSAVNALRAFLVAEAASIVMNDSNGARQTQNNAAINNINNVIIPAIDLWLGYVDFNTAHGQTTCAGFNGYNSNLLAPTKLHSVQLAALQAAVNARVSFASTRTSQVSTVLGTITQDISTGDLLTSTGLYGQRYGFLLLRLDLIGGSLSLLAAYSNASGTQTQAKATIIANKNTYMSVVPTSIFKAAGNGTPMISLVDTSFLSPGDTVFIIAEGQEELQRAVKSVAGNSIILNDIVPEKYRPAEKARLYKDLT